MAQQPPFSVRFFAGLAETTFQAELGVVDPPLVDYVTDLLVRGIRNDRLAHIRGKHGRHLTTIAEMTSEATERIGSARRELHRQIGDFALFWAGIYPESLDDSTDSAWFTSYCNEGKRAYHIASQIEPEEDSQPASTILQRLSERFELCCYGLREIRRHWEEGPGSGPAGRLFFG